VQSRPPPPENYLDTSVLVTAAIHGAPHARAAAAFCAGLVHAQSYVYFSQLVWIEVPQALRKLATRPGNLAPSIRTQYRLDDWGTDPTVRDRWLRHGIAEIEALVTRFREAFELPWNRSVWTASLQVVVQHSLQTLDATHVATAQDIGLQGFAAVDGDFDRVSSLTLWRIRDP
jgi:predicted nucleic acid-binding protein